MSPTPVAVFLAVWFTATSPGCSYDPTTSPPPETAAHQESPSSDGALIRLVTDAAEGIGNPALLKQIEAMAREKLISDLTRIRQGRASDDRLLPQIAFVFCYLKHDYEANRAVIVSAFRKDRYYTGFHGDDAVGLVGTLIAWGDKDLFKVVLEQAYGADTSYATGIQDVIHTESRLDPGLFLSLLRDLPADTKEDIYRLMLWGDRPEDRKFMEYLRQAARRPETAKVAEELIEVLRVKAERQK